jgi:lipopolysaccharide export system permease protein
MIYQRHLINTLITPLVITVFVIVCLVWLSQIIKLAFVIELGVGIFKFIFFTIEALPAIMLSTLPLATTVAGIMGYNYLSSDRELIALSTSGFSNMQIAFPAVKLSLIVTVISYLLAFYVSPLSYHKLKNDLSVLRSGYVSGMIHERTFNQLAKNIVLYIDKKTSGNLMNGIIIFDHRNTEIPVTLFAKTGKLTIDEGDPVFELEDGVRQLVNKRGEMNQMTFSHLLVNLSIQKSVRDATSMDLQEYTIDQLINPIGNYTEARLRQISAEMHQRLTWPAYNTALMLLAISVLLRHKYSRVGNRSAIWQVVGAVSVSVYIHFTFHSMAFEQPLFNLFCYINLIATCGVGYFLLKRD